ncbi:MAG: hypothetical protein HC883_02660 [Bdellovibrionaceae bacterium]|nr:hypothetical protein [Pseudobdellovibrionaceae bacterium]
MKSPLLPHLYEAVAEGAMFGIVVFELQSGECLYINHMARELLGTGTPTLLGMVPRAKSRPSRASRKTY